MSSRTRKKRRGYARSFVPRLPDDYSFALPRKSIFTALAIAFVIQIGVFAYQTSVKGGGADVAAVLPGAIALFTNEARAEVASAPLTVDSRLAEAAQKKADDMASKSYFSHREPNGEMSWYRFKEAGYEYVYAGENLAVNFTDTRQLVDAWLDSPTHRANIIKPQYEDIGIGMATGTYKGREAVFVVQFFGSRHYASPAVSKFKPPTESSATGQSSAAAASDTGLGALLSAFFDLSGGELPSEPAAAVSPETSR